MECQDYFFTGDFPPNWHEADSRFCALIGDEPAKVIRLQHVSELGGRHAVITIAIRDYPRIFAESFHRDIIETGIANAVNNGAIRLVLDQSNEAAGERELVQAAAVLRELGVLDPASVTWLGANTIVDPVAAGRVNHLEYNYFLIKAYCSLAEQMRSEKINSKWIRKSFRNGLRQPYALCLNATPRTQRVASVVHLVDGGLFGDIRASEGHEFHGKYLSFPGFSHSKLGGCDAATAKQALSGMGREDLCDVLDRLEEKVPLRVDNFPETGNLLYNKVDTSLYARTAFSCVTETHWDSHSQSLLTEKTVKPLCLGHPVVIFGGKGQLSLTRRLGFSTFEHVFDSTYDTVSDDRLRIDLAVKACLAAHKLFMDSPRRWEKEVAPSMIANIRWARKGFMEHIRRCYQVPLRRLLASC